MNLGSWIILAIVVAILALAVKATFFGRKGGGCCEDDAGQKDRRFSSNPSRRQATAGLDDQERALLKKVATCDRQPGSSGCAGCPVRCDSATARNAVAPIIKPL